MSRIPKVFIIVFSFAACTVLAIGLRLAYVNTIPTAPIYEHATFIKETREIRETNASISSYYQSTDAPEKIVEFYSQSTTCELSTYVETVGRYICRGKASPFGNYTIYIDSAKYAFEHQTPFVVEVEWERYFIRI
jgi:hypothetical protein